MDNSRKHDSIGTKAHRTASASDQPTATTNATAAAAASEAASNNNGMLPTQTTVSISVAIQQPASAEAAQPPAAASMASTSTAVVLATPTSIALCSGQPVTNSSGTAPPPASAPPGGPVMAGAASGLLAAAMPTSTSSSKTVQRPAVFDKLESLVQDMQDKVHGVPVRHQKVFLTSIPFAFMGYDLIEWLMDRLSIEDSLEAVHLANLLCQFGYYFPIGELKNLLVKDDSSLYRFQSPYYWPSQHHTPDNIEYAIYLAKRSQQRKREKHGLEDYEVEAYNNLKKILANKWDFVMMQSEEQLRLAKDRKRDDKQIIDSQEKAYWRVYRPPPGYTTVVESSPVPTREHRIKARSRTKEHILEEVKFLREYASMSRCKVSQVADSLIDYTDTFLEFDPVLCPVGPSNPWITDDQTYWLLNQPILDFSVDTPTEKRVRKWEISLEDLVLDPLGVRELMEYMKKEYSHENLRFWLAVQELRYGPGNEAKIRKKVKEIWDEFLSPGAKAEINIDGKTMEATKLAMKNPTRYTFEVAAGHVYLLLLKKDCYPRFIRSENYKSILSNAINPGNVRRRIFNFPRVPKRPPKSGTPAGGVPGANTNQGRMPEDFNVYGIHGAGQGDISDSPPDGPDDSTFPRRSDGAAVTAAENVCPWELADEAALNPTSKGSEAAKKGSGGGHVRRGSDPTALTSAKPSSASSATSASTKSRLAYPSGTAAAVAAAASSITPLEATTCATTKITPAATKRASSTSSEHPHDREKSASASTILDHSQQQQRCSGGSGEHEKHRHSESSVQGQSHHHHHHHHHHHVASKRTKNRSRKKKPARAASSAAAASGTTDSEFELPTTGPASTEVTPIKQHHPPSHQHSAASLLTSVAAASVAMASIEGSCLNQQQQQPPPPPAVVTCVTLTATPGAVASATVALIPPMASVDHHACSSVMETKCTQTKLDDDKNLLLAAAAAASAASAASNEAPQEESQSDLKGLKGDELQQPQVAAEKEGSLTTASEAVAASTTTTTTAGEVIAATAESKGELGTWTSSTEVCPWEDEDNRDRDSHPTFVKTYATLGYL